MLDETTDVLIGGYLSAEAARDDYESVLNCGARLLGAVVVTKDLEGNVAVEQTDHMVEEGAAGLASVGFVVGLFAPPLLAATAIGAALGAVGGKALHEKTGSKIEESVWRDDPTRWRRAHRRVPPRGSGPGRARSDPGRPARRRRSRG